MKVTIYTATHKEFDVPMDNIYCPIQVGAASAERDLGYIRDDTGENISVRNCYYGELTGLYWIWKNDNLSDYIGLCHYRRYFVDVQGNLLDKKLYERIFEQYDIIAAVANNGKQSYYELYNEAHYIKDLEVTGVVLREKYPNLWDTYEQLIYGNRSYTGNLMVTSRELFMEYAAWLFDILVEVERRIEVESYDEYHRRVFGFLSEQLLGVWIEGKHLKCLECGIGIMQEKAESRELKDALQEFMYTEKYEQGFKFFEKTVSRRPDVLLKDSDLKGTLQMMYQILAICMQEKERGYSNLARISHDFQVLIPIVKECKAILLRIWNKTVSGKDLVYLRQYNISWVMLIALVLNMPERQGTAISMLNRLGMYFFKEKCMDLVVPFLDYAFQMEPENNETRENLIEVLEAYGEHELAETFKL